MLQCNVKVLKLSLFWLFLFWKAPRNSGDPILGEVEMREKNHYRLLENAPLGVKGG